MAKAFIASWNSLEDGDILLSVRNLKGDELCSFSATCATLGDLEQRLVDPQGPLSEHLRSPLLNFYTAADPSTCLDLHLPLREMAPELCIRQVDAGIWLAKWPYTGKFLEAMRDNKFNQRSRKFDATWTAETAEEVPLREALSLVTEFLGCPMDAGSSSERFVQIFGKLTTSIESWKKFRLSFLLGCTPGLKRFKHFVCQHWMELARDAMVSKDPPPLFLYFKAGGIDRCYVAGASYPHNFEGALTNVLPAQDVDHGFEWRSISKALLFLDREPEAVESFEERVVQEPPEFGSLQPEEILRMVHVQLRLSCCGVAEVQGPMNEVSVRILAELLRYKLTTLKFGSADFDAALQRSEDRGLLLVTDLPTACRGNIFVDQRMILCFAEPRA